MVVERARRGSRLGKAFLIDHYFVQFFPWRCLVLLARYIGSDKFFVPFCLSCSKVISCEMVPIFAPSITHIMIPKKIQL